MCNAVYEENAIEKWINGYIPRFVKKDDLGIVKNYKDITITAIAVKVYNTLLLNRVNLKIEKILRKKIRTIFGEIDPQLVIHQIIKGVRTKTLEETQLYVDFSEVFDSIHKAKTEQILSAYGLQ